MKRFRKDAYGLTALLLASGAVSAALTTQPASAQLAVTTLENIALTGQTTPDGATFTGLIDPVINNAGQVAFDANTSANGGIYLYDGTNLLTIAATGDPTPNGSGTFLFLGSPQINELGQVAFWVPSIDGGSILENSGVFVGDGVTPVARLIREGQTLPGSTSTVRSFDSAPGFNDMGTAAFRVSDSAFNESILLSSGGVLSTVATSGGTAADGDGTYDGFIAAQLNNAGQLAFEADLDGAVMGTDSDVGLFRVDATGAGVAIVREGQADDTGTDTFDQFFFLSDLNESGQVAFGGTLVNGGDGVFRGDGLSTPTTIATEGMSVVGGGTISDIEDDPAINDLGEVVFRASIQGSGTPDDIAVFLGSADGNSLDILARIGQAAPNGDGVIDGLGGQAAINDIGQVVFEARITGTADGIDDDVIFLYDPTLGLIEVVREGDAIDGLDITALSFEAGLFNGDEGSGLNDVGQIAFRYNALDTVNGGGLTGIAIATVIPEPSSLALLALGGLLAARRRR